MGWPTPEDPDGDDDAELGGRNTIADRLATPDEIAAAVVYLAFAEAE